jgi:TRAP-type mannitol/chloroaromatic compound transport system permease small subunit
MKKLIQIINSITELSGQVAKFMIMALVSVFFYEVVSRYIFNNPTNWTLPISIMLMGLFSSCGWAYTYLYDRHVRVDIFYSRLSRRGKAWINVIMSIVFLFPMCIILISAGIKWAIFSWKISEKMIESSWLPPVAPFRTILILCFFIFTLQSISKFIQDVYFLIRKENLI